MNRIPTAPAILVATLVLAACGSTDSQSESSKAPTSVGDATTEVENSQAIPEVEPVETNEVPDTAAEDIGDDINLIETDEELEQVELDINRVDIAIELVQAPKQVRRGESIQFQVVVSSIDTKTVNAPVVRFTVPAGIGIQMLPADCDTDDALVTCVVAPSLSNQVTLPHSSEPFTISLDVLDTFDAASLEVDVTAESFGNPVSNDPNSIDNTVRLSVEIAD